MKTNINHTPLRSWTSIEAYWENQPKNIYGFTTPNYPTLTDAVHYADGWREEVRPEISTTQRLGEKYFDEALDIVTWHVVDIPEEELQQRIINEKLAEADEIERKKQRDDTISFFQTVSVEDALQNQAIFPIWKPDLPFVEATHRYQHWLGMELVLWEVVLSHAPSSYNFPPAQLPALWKRVALPDEILPWVQPLGSFDAYQTGDRVTHVQNSVNKLWQSTHDNNTWAPGVFGWTDLGAYP